MGEKLLILVVDDSEDNQQIALYVLEREGYQVDLAATSAEVRQRMSARRPDLILMDVQLGTENGLDVARALKADRNTANIPIVALTALAQSEYVLAAAGCAGSISKPIDTRAFPAQIREFVTPTSR
jgi:two-component system, cell cycle response regulator DivK